MDSENHSSGRRSIQGERHPIQRRVHEIEDGRGHRSRVHEIEDGRGHRSIHRIRKEPFRSTHA